jgi:TatD DNase family protein
MPGSIELFDSHCHLTDTAFRDDREAVFVRAAEAGVTRMVLIASDIDDAGEARVLASAKSGVWCTAGIHPHEAGNAPPNALDQVRALADASEVVAIGETGLDFFYDNAPRQMQQELFEGHLRLGAELDLPVVVHAREADEEIAAALRAAPAGTRGVLHCFTGGEKAFAEARARDWYVSFSGIASFKSFGALELLREVPLDRLLIETDSPYLAPVPHRGRRNEPALVLHVAEAVAGLLDLELEAVACSTTENACRFYRV